ncbi:helix-turn-helix transcriptional regulator [Pantoea sp. LS15]|uniref:response regulator transcription factor n=1 Tax=Enterobacterales TaxID=91347 RepID=UPI000E0F1EBF|nr:helix-turn-helix transcriptional regulator [Pantoea sp. LS15]NKF48934.1 helix-turn-helix transcriptional regulator [Pantoea sp. LS15]RDK12383.1 LuxR family transcriptional regulator [Enterobacter sp. 9-2]
MEKESKKTCIVCRIILTRREKQILYKLSEGFSSSEIAKNIGLHVKSVSQHKRNAMRKLSLPNTKELLLWLVYNKINIDI